MAEMLEVNETGWDSTWKSGDMVTTRDQSRKKKWHCFQELKDLRGLVWDGS